MHIALVCDVENKAIFGCIKDAVQADSKLDDSEVGADVPAILRCGLNDTLSYLRSELR